MADPLTVTTGIISLIAAAINMVVGAVGLVEKTTDAHRAADNQLKDLLRELKELERRMGQIHDQLQILANKTKNRGLKKVLQGKFGKIAVKDLCDALDATFDVLERHTDSAKKEKSNLQSLALPDDTKSLEYVQAILKHNLVPSNVAEVVNNLKNMQSEIQACLKQLEGSFNHFDGMYSTANASSTSLVSTSTIHNARTTLADWLKQRERTWGLSNRCRSHGLELDFRSSDPVRRLPPDVLSKVLDYLCSNGPLPLRFVLFVSKSLYQAAVHDASLWTTISFDDEFFCHFKTRTAKQANSFVEQCLLRSDRHPLSLSIHDFGLFDRDILLGHLKSFGKRKYRGFERCSSLEWVSGMIGNDHTILDLFPAVLPSLQYMSLIRFDDQDDGSRFPDCPALVTVAMLDRSNHYPSFWGTNFAQVTTLSFGNSDFNRWRDLNLKTLSLFPLLHDLTLVTVKKGPLAASETLLLLKQLDAQPPIHFQHLKILRAHGRIPSGAISKLVALTLKELHIKGDTDNFTPVGTLLDPSGILISNRSALHSEALSMTGLERVPTIETLHISKWMERECEEFLNDSIVILHVL